MPLFRFHRSSLEESLQTTIIVKTFDDMVKAIIMAFDEHIIKSIWNKQFEVKPYPSENECFESRIGWYAQIVSANMYEENKMHPIGFLSEPFYAQISSINVRY